MMAYPVPSEFTTNAATEQPMKDALVEAVAVVRSVNGEGIEHLRYNRLFQARACFEYAFHLTRQVDAASNLSGWPYNFCSSAAPSLPTSSQIFASESLLRDPTRGESINTTPTSGEFDHHHYATDQSFLLFRHALQVHVSPSGSDASDCCMFWNVALSIAILYNWGLATHIQAVQTNTSHLFWEAYGLYNAVCPLVIQLRNDLLRGQQASVLTGQTMGLVNGMQNSSPSSAVGSRNRSLLEEARVSIQQGEGRMDTTSVVTTTTGTASPGPESTNLALLAVVNQMGHIFSWFHQVDESDRMSKILVLILSTIVAPSSPTRSSVTDSEFDFFFQNVLIGKSDLVATPAA